MQNDEELMSLAQSGDKEAFETLVLRYRKSATGFAYRFLRQPEDAEDVVQDCFARIWIHRENYRPQAGFKTYLYAAVRNRCVDLLRTRSSRPPAFTLEELPELEGSPSPETEYSRLERAAEIRSVLESFKSDYRTALYLFAAEEMSYAEIAKVMKRTVPQVKILLFRARKKLKSALEGGESV